MAKGDDELLLAGVLKGFWKLQDWEDICIPYIYPTCGNVTYAWPNTNQIFFVLFTIGLHNNAPHTLYPFATCFASSANSIHLILSFLSDELAIKEGWLIVWGRWFYPTTTIDSLSIASNTFSIEVAVLLHFFNQSGNFFTFSEQIKS